jgi:tripartite-type tricarboxylate transporter receptor subunit TctC
MKLGRRHLLLGSGAGGLTVAGVRGAAGQTWPVRSIRHVVPFPAGGITDILARRFAERLSVALGQSVIVENRPGAAGAVGVAAVGQARPDGYTVLDAGMGTHVFNPMIHPQLGYDPQRDFAPVTLLTRFTPALMVSTASGWRSFGEFVAAVRADPRRVVFGSSGNGSPGHVVFELFKRMLGVELLHIPYAGDAPALNDMHAGQIQAMFGFPISALGMIQARQVIPLAVAGPRRLPIVPEAPTTTELGLAGLQMSVWRALFLPVGAPRAIVDRLAEESRRVMELPEIVAHCHSAGVEPQTSTPEALADLIRSDTETWGPIIRQANIRVT